MNRADHALTLTVHHIAADGWSLGVLAGELDLLYRAFAGAAPEPAPLPEPQLQFADFARWQRDWFRGEVLERQLAYWRERLAGDIPTLDLPTDRVRPLIRRFEGGGRELRISPELGQALRRIGRSGARPCS